MTAGWLTSVRVEVRDLGSSWRVVQIHEYNDGEYHATAGVRIIRRGNPWQLERAVAELTRETRAVAYRWGLTR